MVDVLLTGLALVFIIEGIFPFANPKKVKVFFAMASSMGNKLLRFLGFLSISTGLILLYIVH